MCNRGRGKHCLSSRPCVPQTTKLSPMTGRKGFPSTLGCFIRAFALTVNCAADLISLFINRNFDTTPPRCSVQTRVKSLILWHQTLHGSIHPWQTRPKYCWLWRTNRYNGRHSTMFFFDRNKPTDYNIHKDGCLRPIPYVAWCTLQAEAGRSEVFSQEGHMPWMETSCSATSVGSQWFRGIGEWRVGSWRVPGGGVGGLRVGC